MDGQSPNKGIARIRIMTTPNQSPLRQKHQVYQGKPRSFDQVIQELTGFTTEATQQLICMGGAYLGKCRCKNANAVVRPGVKVSAYWRWPLVMEPVPFRKEWILYQDRMILLANKPAGMPTQGRRDADYMAFYEVLKDHLPGYLGLHHRLDQDTSGLMLFAKNRKANVPIAKAFQERTISKSYLAICEHWPSSDLVHQIQAPLAPLSYGQGTRQTVSSKGKMAITRFTHLATEGSQCLILAQPITGRTHQIRAHLAHWGIPLIGDQHYDSPHQGPFMLHCAQLSWPKLNSIPQRSTKASPPPGWASRLSPQLLRHVQKWIDSPC